MLLSDAFMKAIESYDWEIVNMPRYGNSYYDYDFWKQVAALYFGEYRGNKDYRVVSDYYDKVLQELTDKLLELGEDETDEELEHMLSEGRIISLMQSALNPLRNIKFSLVGETSSTPKPQPTKEELAREKARQLLNQDSYLSYYDQKLVDAIGNYVSVMIRGYTFSSYLFKLMNEYKYDSVEVYKAAGFNRQQFSKMKKSSYQPNKSTVFALIIAMKLELNEAVELMKYAGYAFSPSSKLDRMIEFFVRERIFNMDLVNYILYKNDLSILGSRERD